MIRRPGASLAIYALALYVGAGHAHRARAQGTPPRAQGTPPLAQGESPLRES